MKELEQPLVSIIVITYNSSNFILETLKSIKKQIFQNIELVISDDCSSDNTIEICEKWLEWNKERFIRSEIITVQKNTGIPSNCNRGIKHSTGKWIKLIAADDYLLDTCIEDNISFVRKNPLAKFVISDLLEIDEKGDLIDNDVQENKALKFYFSAKTAKSQLKAYTRWPEFLNSPTFFIIKDLLTEIDYFDEGYRIYDDMPLIYRVNLKGYMIYYLNKATVKYRIHDNSISRGSLIDNVRGKEVLAIFDKYRESNLNKFNLIDLSIYYERWLTYYWKGIKGHKGQKILYKLSLFYWYVKYKEFVNNFIK